MDKPICYPFYFKLSHILIAIIGFIFIVYVGQNIIAPLIFAMIIAILLNPLVNFLVKKRVNRLLSICIALILALLFTTGLIYFIASQLSLFSDALPQLKQKLLALLNEAEVWVSRHLNVSTSKIDAWITAQKKEGINNSTSMIGETISTVGGLFVMILLVPVYVFLFLFYKPLLLEFIHKIFPVHKDRTVNEVLAEVKALIQSYLVGLMIEAAIVTTLFTSGLLLIGIDYAILIGIIGAILNLIPYIGGIIATLLPMTLALATKEPVHALYVLILYVSVQLIDNNLIVPKIVASKVKINALVSIVIVLIGGALWGVAGMFLSLPLIAICKVICDRIETMQPVGFLLGDNMPDVTIFKRKPRT
ncbi:MAG: yhhT [Bacteroidetes bacterium]|jgi:predicted PurR-regulated permease PerM|nr:yhhT [Bacteroidota bacterium]MDF2452579.1 yhhT [Bacteroidota bacterium]